MIYNNAKKVILIMIIFTLIILGGCSTAGNGSNALKSKIVGDKKSSMELQKNSTQNNITNSSIQNSQTEDYNASNKSNSTGNNPSAAAEGKTLNPPADSLPVKKNTSGIPVLMYHSVMYEKGNELRIPREKFYEEMKYLKDNGYTTLTLDELYDCLANDKSVPEKSIAITFDDGYVDNYTNAYPVLKEFGFKATVFMITCTVDTDSSYLTSAELKEMEANGIQIEGHTVKHDELYKLSYEAQLKTLKESKKFIDTLLNKDVKYLAYPFGKYNENTLKAAKEAGYKMAFTTIGGWADKSDGIMTLNRVYISSSASLEDFKYRITHPNYNKQ